jgi:hypothetical protein
MTGRARREQNSPPPVRRLRHHFSSPGHAQERAHVVPHPLREICLLNINQRRVLQNFSQDFLYSADNPL